MPPSSVDVGRITADHDGRSSNPNETLHMSQETSPSGPVFRRENVLLQVVLNLLTGGLWGYWCLYQQTQVVNAFSAGNAVPSWLVGAALISYPVFLVLYTFYFVNLPQPPSDALGVSRLVAIGTMVGWSMLVRRGINALSSAKLGDAHWISLPLTLLALLFNSMSPMYFQFIINRVLAARGRD